MKIIIVGSGSVGEEICTQLEGEGHDITIIDSDIETVDKITNKCDVFGVIGNGADISALRKADAENADLLVAVTCEDEINILCCAAAKKLGTKHTAARVRNPEYSEFMALMGKEMNLSLTINPELAVANEIYRMLRFPFATRIDTFCHGKVEMAEMVVSSDSALCGVTLNDLRSRLNMRFLVCCVLRGGEAYIPSGYFKIEAGDVICFTVPDEDFSRFFKEIGAYKNHVRDVLISGGGRTTYYLESLLAKRKIKSTVIEKDKAKCAELVERYNCTVINGDCTDKSLLMEEGVDKKDAFVALSDEDEENAIVSMFAKAKNTRKVITMIRSDSYIELFKSVGLDTIVSPQLSTASYILKFVRSMASASGSKIESLYKLMDEKVEALEFCIREEVEGITGVMLKDIRLKTGILIACIVHGDKIIIPSGEDVINKGDTVVIVTTTGQIQEIKEILK